MKPKYRIASGLLCVLLLSGCSAAVDSPTDDSETTTSEISDAQTYREVILQLQQQLEDMREAQLQQANDYEKEIAKLEAVIAGMTAVGGNSGEESNSDPNENASQAQFTYFETADGIVIQSYLGGASAVEIPASIEGVAVVGIGEGAFRNSSVEQVILPAGIQTVDWFAFYGSYRLRSVVLPSSVNLIEYGAFELCSSSLKFTCPSGSYAAQYAASYGIPVVISDF